LLAPGDFPRRIYNLTVSAPVTFLALASPEVHVVAL
jgi:hypothetical protein